MNKFKYVLMAAVAACGSPPSAPTEKSSTSHVTSQASPSEIAEAQAQLAKLSNNSIPLCKPSKGSGVTCFAMGRVGTDGKMWTTSIPVAGYAASDLQDAYQIPTSGGAGTTVALIEFGDYPTAEDDLAIYRSQNNMKACTTANGCFRKVNEQGELLLPPAVYNNQASSQPASAPVEDDGWSTETALDLDMVSAACPNCSILLVEANEVLVNDPDFGPYYTLVFDDATASLQTAIALGATAVSNSYGFPEDASLIATQDPQWNNPGVSIFVSSGDSGFVTFFPSASEYVIAVGGTNLARDNNADRGWTETAWNAGSSGCSMYVSKPAWQTDSSCPNRMVADVSAVGDPATGVAVFAPYVDPFTGENDGSFWQVFGGTSVSSPLMAGIWAATGLAGQDASWAYNNQGAFNDVTEGANGICDPNVQYECTAGPGYDGPTGFGTPDAALFSSAD